MSNKTKIVVFHMKEMIYTLIFAGLGILLILLLIFMFLPKQKDKTAETMKYVAGVYTSTIQFNDNTIDVQVVVDESQINSISLVNLDDTVATMYPLMQPAVENLADPKATGSLTWESAARLWKIWRIKPLKSSQPNIFLTVKITNIRQWLF